MNRSTFRKLSLTWSAVAFLLGLPSFPALAQDDHDTGPGALYVEDLATLESKFLDLADAMSSEQYLWRPMDSVRSVSEVFMLIVAENYVVPSAWGAESPEGMTVDRSLFTSLAEVTDKETVKNHLRESFAYYKEVVAHLSDEQMHSSIQFFGQERSVNEALYLISGDMHEHLGQAIAYARANEVVPPWTARRQANQ